jgi:hypothetical protein
MYWEPDKEYSEPHDCFDPHELWVKAAAKRDICVTTLSRHLNIRTATMWGYTSGKVRWPADVFIEAMSAIGAFGRVKRIKIAPQKYRCDKKKKRHQPKPVPSDSPVSGESLPVKGG